MRRLYSLLAFSLTATGLWAQPSYRGQVITGQLVLTQSVNISDLARGAIGRAATEDPVSEASLRAAGPRSLAATNQAAATMPSLPITSSFTGTGFDGLTHLDQRLSYNGNQFSTEPPSPGIAVNNGFVLEGVNSAIQVYTTGGTSLLAKALSTNQLFGLAPSCITDFSQTPPKCGGPFGPRLTDMRVFYDQSIDRWFVIQRAQDYNTAGTALNTSHLYLAVSQSGYPAGVYNIYVMETTNAANQNCPCLSDYPQVGADQYGLHISSNEFSTYYNQFVDVAILSISKSSLAAGVTLPVTYRIIVRPFTGYDFALQPATTPPGGSYFTGGTGVEYLISSRIASSGNNIAVWALSNTSSLDTASPALTLSQKIIPSLTYVLPDVATQRPGPLPYGSTLHPAGLLAKIDGADSRVLSVSYAGGRLYATLATQVNDEDGHSLIGGAYFVLSPTFRAGTLGVFSLKQGFLSVRNNNLLRPAIAVNAQGRGAIAFSLIGPDYYPSAAFIPIDNTTLGTAVQIAAAGVAPEDGFTGYPGGFFPQTGIARWGDYSAAFAASDGSVWMATEYIPNAPRTDFANWGTFLMRYTF